MSLEKPCAKRRRLAKDCPPANCDLCVALCFLPDTVNFRSLSKQSSSCALNIENRPLETHSVCWVSLVKDSKAAAGVSVRLPSVLPAKTGACTGIWSSYIFHLMVFVEMLNTMVHKVFMISVAWRWSIAIDWHFDYFWKLFQASVEFLYQELSHLEPKIAFSISKFTPSSAKMWQNKMRNLRRTVLPGSFLLIWKLQFLKEIKSNVILGSDEHPSRNDLCLCVVGMLLLRCP